MKLLLPAAAALACAGCLLSGRRLGGLPKRAALFWTAGLLAAVLVRASFRWFPDLEYDLLPFDAYAVLHPWWAFPFAFAILGVGTRQMGTPLARRLVWTFSGLLAVFVAEEVYLTSAIEPEALDGKPGADGICRQTSGTSCGAAAACTLLARLGVPSDEREMATLCRTNAFTGTDEFCVCRGLRRKLAGTGRRVSLERAGWEDLRRLTGPAMATVTCAPFVDHWIVILSSDEAGVLVGDPLEPRPVRLSRDDLLSRWRGVLVTVEPGAVSDG